MPLAEIAVNLAFVTVTTRVLFGQAFDRLLPVGVAKISDRNHAPNVAISIVLVIGIGFCFLTSLVNLGSIVALQSLFFTLVGAATTVLALFTVYELVAHSSVYGKFSWEWTACSAPPTCSRTCCCSARWTARS